MVTYTAIVCVLIFVTVTLHHTHAASSSLQMSKISDLSSGDNEKHSEHKNSDKQQNGPNHEDGDGLEDEESDDDDENEEEGEEEEELAAAGTSTDYEERNCSCDSSSSCLCCINLNLSFIDLGGPGCVKFLYLPNNDSVAVDMSYGQRLLQSNSIKRSTPEATCMDLFSDLAQMCTRFTKVDRVQNGIKGCLTVEPVLLGVVQSSYNVGCFNMDQPGVQPLVFESTTQRVKNSTTDQQQVKPTETNEEFDEELADAISQSAEDGLAWFNTLISSVLGDDVANDTQSAESTIPSTAPLNNTQQNRHSITTT